MPISYSTYEPINPEIKKIYIYDYDPFIQNAMNCRAKTRKLYGDTSGAVPGKPDIQVVWSVVGRGTCAQNAEYKMIANAIVHTRYGYVRLFAAVVAHSFTWVLVNANRI